MELRSGKTTGLRRSTTPAAPGEQLESLAAEYARSRVDRAQGLGASQRSGEYAFKGSQLPRTPPERIQPTPSFEETLPPLSPAATRPTPIETERGRLPRSQSAQKPVPRATSQTRQPPIPPAAEIAATQRQSQRTETPVTVTAERLVTPPPPVSIPQATPAPPPTTSRPSTRMAESTHSRRVFVSDVGLHNLVIHPNNGKNFRAWLKATERTLLRQGVLESDMCEIIAHYLEGDALEHWHLLLEQGWLDKYGWKGFKESMLREFTEHDVEVTLQKLASIKWQGNSTKYINEFGRTLNGCQPPRTDYVLFRFLANLPREVSRKVCKEGKSMPKDWLEAAERLREYHTPLEDFDVLMNAEEGRSRLLAQQLSDRTRGRDRIGGRERMSREERAPTRRVFFDEGRNRNEPPFGRVFDKFEKRHDTRDSRNTCSRCGGRGHGESRCPVRDSETRPGQICSRCGGKGHWRRECTSYAEDRYEARRREDNRAPVKREVHLMVGTDDEQRGNDMA